MVGFYWLYDILYYHYEKKVNGKKEYPLSTSKLD